MSGKSVGGKGVGKDPYAPIEEEEVPVAGGPTFSGTTDPVEEDGDPYYDDLPLGEHEGQGVYRPTGYSGSAQGKDSTLPDSQGGLDATWLDNNRRFSGPGFDADRWRQFGDWNQNRRGSGSGSSGMRFDQDYLIQSIADWWRFNMVEAPSNPGALVAEYMADSRRQRMSLNLDAWLWQKARSNARYHLLYGGKPAELSEGEYISKLRGVAEEYGLSGGAFNQQVTAGAQAGQSAQGFASRVSDLRQVRTGNLGLFSRKVAQTVASLGSLGRGR